MNLRVLRGSSFGLILESKNHAHRQSQIILRRAEKLCAQIVPFQSRRERTQKPVIQSTSYRGRERSIRGPGQRAPGVDVRGSNHYLGEGFEFARGHSEPGPHQIFLFVSRDADIQWTIGRGFYEILRAVVAADVAHDPHERQNFSLERSFPPMQVGPAQSVADLTGTECGRIRTFVRISEKNVSRGYLCARQTGGNK